MKLENIKMAVAGVWVLGACIIAVLGEVHSIRGWAAVVALGLLPALVLMRMWQGPTQTLSESISEARR